MQLVVIVIVLKNLGDFMGFLMRVFKPNEARLPGEVAP